MPDSEDKKSKGQVRYRPKSAQAREKCANCVMFSPHTQGRYGDCSLVAGTIEGDHVCDRWEPKR